MMLTEEQLRNIFTATNSSEPLCEGWPGLERFARKVEETVKEEYGKDILDVLNAYEGKTALFCCQGQGMDGYSALANFLDIARKLRDEIEGINN